MRTLLYQASTMDWRFALLPQNSYAEFIFACDCVWKQAFGEAIRPWALTRVMKIFIREAERDPLLYHHVKIQEDTKSLQPARGLSSDTQSAGVLTLDFPAFEIWKVNFLKITICEESWEHKQYVRKGLKQNFHVFTLLYGDSVSNRPEQLECKRTKELIFLLLQLLWRPKVLS